MYKDEYHPQIKKDLKSLDKTVIADIVKIHISNILKNPNSYDKLSGEFKGLFSYHLQKNKVEYRISYIVDNNEKVVYILMIGKRENFYKILKRRI